MKFRKHCSDEQLLAALDGELPEAQRSEVMRHLEACWACRARQAEIESQVHLLTRAAAQSLYPEGGWSTLAKRRFSLAARALEPAAPARPPSSPARWRWQWAWPAAAGITVVVVFAVYSSGWLRPAAAPAPVRAGLQQLIEADRSVAATPVHQVVRVQIEQTRPRIESRARRLEVWSDPEGGRHALHWRDQGGLRQAAWRSGNGVVGVSRAFAGTPPESPDLVAAVGNNWSAGEMEEAFLAWLAARVWEPVVLSGDFSIFATDFGTRLVAERVKPGIVRLTAKRQRAQVMTEWIVEMDERTHRPRLQRIRWERPETAMEIHFVVESEARLDAATLRPAVFHSPFPPKPPAPPVFSEARPAALHADPALPARKVELTTAGIQAQYALRRMPREWVEAIEVDFENSRVVVRGVTQTAEMRQGIEAVLGRLEWVVLAVQSVEETAAAADPAEAEVAWVEPAEEPTFPLDKELAQRLAVPGDKPETARRVAAFSAQAARLASGILSESWALHRLAERYPAERLALVRPETRWLLDELRESHLRSLNQARAELQALVTPVLGPLALVQPRPATVAPPAGQPVPESALLQSASEMDAVIRGLLAGAPLGEVTPRDAVTRLILALERLEPETARIRTAWQAGPDIRNRSQ
jgi:hypothetical protein